MAGLFGDPLTDWADETTAARPAFPTIPPVTPPAPATAPSLSLPTPAASTLPTGTPAGPPREWRYIRFTDPSGNQRNIKVPGAYTDAMVLETIRKASGLDAGDTPAPEGSGAFGGNAGGASPVPVGARSIPGGYGTLGADRLSGPVEPPPNPPPIIPGVSTPAVPVGARMVPPEVAAGLYGMPPIPERKPIEPVQQQIQPVDPMVPAGGGTRGAQDDRYQGSGPITVGALPGSPGFTTVPPHTPDDTKVAAADAASGARDTTAEAREPSYGSAEELRRYYGDLLSDDGAGLVARAERETDPAHLRTILNRAALLPLADYYRVRDIVQPRLSDHDRAVQAEFENTLRDFFIKGAVVRGGITGTIEQNPKLFGLGLQALGSLAPEGWAHEGLDAVGAFVVENAMESPEGYEMKARGLFTNDQTIEGAFTWAGEAFGQGVSSLGPVVVAALAGGTAGTAIGGPVGGVVGTVGGAGLVSYFLNAGSVVDGLMQKGMSQDEAEWWGARAGIPMAALDSLVPVAVATRLGAGGTRKAATDYIVNRILADMATEGATEGAQRAIELGTSSLALDEDFLTTDNLLSVIEDTIAGAMVGGAVAVVTPPAAAGTPPPGAPPGPAAGTPPPAVAGAPPPGGRPGAPPPGPTEPPPFPTDGGPILSGTRVEVPGGAPGVAGARRVKGDGTMEVQVAIPDGPNGRTRKVWVPETDLRAPGAPPAAGAGGATAPTSAVPPQTATPLEPKLQPTAPFGAGAKVTLTTPTGDVIQGTVDEQGEDLDGNPLTILHDDETGEVYQIGADDGATIVPRGAEAPPAGKPLEGQPVTGETVVPKDQTGAAAPAPAAADPGPWDGPSEEYKRALFGQESRGGDPTADNPNSSAYGRYQFIEPTWEGLMRDHPELGLTAAGRTGTDQDSLDQQDRAFDAFTRANADVLRGSGFELTDKNLYLAHFLGAGGAVQMLEALKASPNDLAINHANPASVASNRSVFYDGDRPRTVAEMVAHQTRRFGGTVTTGGASAPAGQPGGSGEVAPVETPEAAAPAQEAQEREEDRSEPQLDVRPPAEAPGRLPDSTTAADLPEITHTYGNGQTITGSILPTQAAAAALDPYTFQKDGGWFVRSKFLIKAKEAKGAPDSIVGDVLEGPAGDRPATRRISVAGSPAAAVDFGTPGAASFYDMGRRLAAAEEDGTPGRSPEAQAAQAWLTDLAKKTGQSKEAISAMAKAYGELALQRVKEAKGGPVKLGSPTEEREALEAIQRAATAPIRGYTTSMGSRYQVHDDGTTTRNKAALPDYGHEGDSGPKERSARTVYLTDKDTQRLAPPQDVDWRVVVDDKNGGLTLITRRDKNGPWGATKSARDVPFSTAPKVGLHPFEMWKPEEVQGRVDKFPSYRKIHPGNAITALEREAAAAKPSATVTPIKPKSEEKPSEKPKSPVSGSGVEVAPPDPKPAPENENKPAAPPKAPPKKAEKPPVPTGRTDLNDDFGNYSLESGAVLTDKEGRQMSPSPSWDASTNLKLKGSIRRQREWLIAEAHAAAKARGHTGHEVYWLRGLKADNVPPASFGDLNDYLFGDDRGPALAAKPPRAFETPAKFKVGDKVTVSLPGGESAAGIVQEIVTDYDGNAGLNGYKVATTDGKIRLLAEVRLKAREDEPAPKPAPKDGDLTPEERKTLAQVFAAHLDEASAAPPFRTIVDARKLAEQTMGRPVDPKVVEEQIEAGVVMVAREIMRQRSTAYQKFDKLVALYQRQPILGTRTSSSIERQAYSTPAPLAFVASRLSGIGARQKGVRIYEPTAGNGMLLLEANPATVTANEIDAGRRRNLQMVLGPEAHVEQNDASAWAPNGTFDIIIANPPFGKVQQDGRPKLFSVDGVGTTEIDHAISLKALQHLNDGGRAVLIIGGLQGTEDERRQGYRGDNSRRFYKKLYETYRVTRHFTVDGRLYQRQGAGWPVDVIVIEGRGASDLEMPMMTPPQVLETWDDVREQLNDRVDPAKQPQEPGNRPPAEDPPGGPDPGGVPPGPGGQDRPDGGQDTPGGPAPAPRAPGGKRGSGGAGPRGPRGAAGPKQPVADKPGGDAEQTGAGGATSGRPGSSGGPGGGQPGGIPGGTLPGPVGAPAPKPADYGKSNTLFTEEAAKAAAAKLSAKFRQLNSGLDPETVFLMIQQAGYHIEAGIRKFVDVARAIAAEIGATIAQIRPYLRGAYNGARDIIEDAGRDVSDMDSPEAVKAALAALDNEPAPAPAPEPEPEPEDAPAPKGDRKNEEVETTHQVHYTPTSKAKYAVGTLVPRNMQTAMDRALAALSDRVGDIDRYVAKKLGYKAAEMDDYFSAEQVDALALALDNVDRGAGFIIGDQTGVGKGRVVAAMLRYAERTGRTPIFMTKDPALYGDMVRDFRDIGMPDVAKSILISNNDLRGADMIPLSDEPGDTLGSLPPAKHKAAIIEMAQTGRLPEGFRYLFTTYSQSQYAPRGRGTPRQAAFTALAPNALVVLDESHEAGGTEAREVMPDGKIKPTRADYVRGLLKAAGGAVYSSATYAKNPTVMSLYFKTDVALAVDDIEKLAGVIQAGGVPLQQVIANMLVEAGQYVRRERSFDGVSIEMDELDADLKLAGRASAAMRAIFRLDVEFLEPARENFIEELARQGIGVSKDGGVGQASATGVGFGQVMHNVVSQLLLSINAPAVADKAIALARAGEKPIVALANTNQAILEDYLKNEALAPGEKLSLTFATVLSRYLGRLRRITIKNDDALRTTTHITMTDEDLRTHGGDAALAAYRRVEREIREADLAGLTASPVDYILDRLEDAGIKADEITGRTLMLRRGRPEVRMASGAAKKRVMNDYNAGRIDALVMNRSGSTGYSMHATNQRGNDGKQRHMVLLQPDTNIDTFMQMLGRIHRTGQVKLPKYTLATSTLAVQKRPAAVLMRKMGSLNANTTASKKGALTIEASDFLNRYGDEVVRDYLRENTDVANLVDITVPFVGAAPEGLAAKLTGRLAIMAPDEVERVYTEIEAAYREHIETLDRMGMNALEAKTIDYQAKTLGDTPLTPEKSPSPFGQASVIETVSVRKLGEPMTLPEIGEEVAKALGGLSVPAKTAEHLRRLDDAMPILEASQREALEAAQQRLADATPATRGAMIAAVAVARWNEAIKEAAGHLVTIKGLIEEARPGRGVIVRVRDGAQEGWVYGFVIGVDSRKIRKNPLAASQIIVRVAIADANRELRIPLSQMIGTSNAPARYNITPTSEDMLTGFRKGEAAKAFEAGGQETREQRQIITGNLVAGYAKFQRGQFILFTDTKGDIRQGIMMPRDFDAKAAIEALNPEFDSTAQVLRFIREGEGRRIVHSTDQRAMIQGDGKGGLILEILVRDGKPWYLLKAVRDIVGDFVARRGDNKFKKHIPADKAEAVLDAYRDNIGATFEARTFKPEARKIIEEMTPTPDPTPPAGGPRPTVKASDRGPAADAVPPPLASASSLEGIRASLAKSLGARLKELGLEDVALRIANKLEYQSSDGQTRQAQGLYHEVVRLIEISLSGARNTWDTLNHEALHALREIGAFTDPEWAALVKAAWANRAIRERVLAGWPGATMEERQEEAVAELFAEYNRMPGDVPGPIRALLDRIRAILGAIYDAVTGGRQRRAREIMDEINAGRATRTPRMQIPEAGEAAWRKTLQDPANRAAYIAGEAGRDRMPPGWGVLPQTAYHGSPHDFDAFTTQKIGTGEGSQSFGWGMYFAGKKEVAEYYRDSLAKGGHTFLGQPLSTFGNGGLANYYPVKTWTDANVIVDDAAIALVGHDNPAAVGQAIQMLAPHGVSAILGAVMRAPYPTAALDSVREDLLADLERSKDIRDRIEVVTRVAVIDALKRTEAIKGPAPARLYEVDLAPEEHEWLAYEEPLSKQTPTVVAALARVRKTLQDRVQFLTEWGGTGVSSAFKDEHIKLLNETIGWIDGKKTVLKDVVTGEILTHRLSDLFSTNTLLPRGEVTGARAKGPREASLFLLEHGIPGNRFLDQGSRNALFGKRTHNYVVFDDSHVKVLAKYSIADQVRRGAFPSAGPLRQHLLAGRYGEAVDRMLKAGSLALHDSLPADRPAGAMAWTDEDGKINLVADRLTADTVMPVLLHEAFHGRVKALIGPQAWARLLADLRSLHGQFQGATEGNAAGRFYSAALDRMDAAAAAGDRIFTEDRFIEEFGAYALEEYDRAPKAIKDWAIALLGHVRAWLVRRFGLQVGEVTPAQLRALAAAALRDGRIETGPAQGVRYAIGPTPAGPTIIDEAMEDLEAADDITVDRGDFYGQAVPDQGAIGNTISSPRQVAALYREFTDVYLTALSQQSTRERHVADLTEALEPYHNLSADERVNANKVLELGRLYGRSYGPTALGAGVRNDGLDAALTRPGDVVTLTPREADGYRAARRTMDLALNKLMEQQLRALGLEAYIGMAPTRIIAELTALAIGRPAREAARIRNMARLVEEFQRAKRAGYVPFSRFGDLVVAVKEFDAGTETTVYSTKVEPGVLDAVNVWQAKRGRKDIREIKAVATVIEDLQARYVDGFPNRRIVAFQASEIQREEGVNLSEVDVLARLADIDPAEWGDVFAALEKAQMGRGFRKHFLHSENVPGYSPDFGRSLADYIIGASGAIARQQHLPLWEAAIAKIKQQKRLREYAEAYRRHFDGPGSDWALVRQVGFVMYLGLNIISAVRNLTQLPIGTYPTLSKVAPDHRVIAEMARAAKDVTLMMVTTPPKKSFNFFDPDAAPADVRAMVREAWDNGGLGPQAYLDVASEARTSSQHGKRSRAALDWATRASGVFFSNAERFNRLVTMIAAARLARDPETQRRAEENLSGDALARKSILGANWSEENFAIWATDESQFRMGKLNRPKLMRGIGAALLQFKNFPLQMVEAMVRSAVLHGRAGRKALARMLAMLVVFGGLTGLPFLDDIRRIVESAHLEFTGVDLDIRDELRQEIQIATTDLASAITDEGMAELLGQAVGRSFTRGVPFAAGVDMSATGLGNLTPGMDLTGTIPIDMAMRIGSFGGDIIKGRPWYTVAQNVAPAGLRNTLLALEWSEIGVRKKSGNSLIPYTEVTAWDIAAKAIGFNSTHIIETRDIDYTLSRASRAYLERNDRYLDRLAMAMAAQERAREAQDTDALVTAMEETNAIMAEIQEINAEAQRNNDPHSAIRVTASGLRDRVRRELMGAAAAYGRERTTYREDAAATRALYGIGIEE